MINNHIVKYYDSLALFVEEVARLKEANEIRHAGAGEEKPRQWNHSCGFKQALERAVSGDEEIMGKASRLLDQIEPLTTSEASVHGYVPDVCGSRPYMAGYLSGSPRAMMRRRSTLRDKRHVGIWFDMSSRCDVDAASLLRRGAATIALVERLQASNVSTSLHLVASGCRSSCDPSSVHTFIVIDLPKPVTLSTYAFAIAHPGFIRTLCYDMLTTLDPDMPLCIPLSQLSIVETGLVALSEGDVYIPLIQKPLAPSEVEGWITKHVRRVLSLPE